MAEFVSGSFDSVVFWESKTFSKRRAETPFMDSGCHLSSLTWSSSNSKLAVVPRKGDRVALCEFQDGATTWTYLNHKAGCKFCSGCLLQSSRYLASGSEDSSVHIWDLKNRKIFKSFPGHTSPVTSITHHHADEWIVSGGRDGAIIMHSVENSSSKQFLQGPCDKAINRLRFSHVERGQFGSVGEDGLVCVWSVESRRLLNKYSSPHTSAATDLCFSPSNNMLMISVGMDSRIKCYDIQTRKIVTEVPTPSPLSSVTMLKDGSTLLAGSTDGKLYVYELRILKYPKATLDGHTTPITCVAQQSYSRHSSRSKSRSSSSKGKHTPSSHLSSTPDGSGAEYSPPVGSAISNHLQQDGANVFTTPASHRAQTSSIFSPLDPNLVTPAPGIRPTVPGAALPTPTTTVATPTPPAQIPSATRSHPAPPAPETSGIFSPLLISHTKPERSGGEVGGGKHAEFNGTMAQDEYDGGKVADGGGGGGVKSKGLAPTAGQLQLADMLERQSLDTPSQPSNPALSSTQSMFSSVPDSATSSSADPLGSVENEETELRGAALAPPPPSDAAHLPPCNSVQMKYLEAMIRDAHEETCQSLHQDIRALSVDNIKFFCSLQQQLASQNTALMEKVDRLTEELKRVEEMVHQYMPKH